MTPLAQHLSRAQQQGASDLHISAGAPPMWRIDGEITPLDTPALSADEARDWIYSIMNEAQIRDFENTCEADFSIETDNARFRVNVFCQARGIAAVFRTIASAIPTLTALGCPKHFADIIDAPRGLVLVTGPTGSGKSTTLAAMLNHINENKKQHILTIEDPIEFIHTPKNCLINQRQIQRDTQSFAHALRAGLREDPDVILVGELRDLETIRLALTAAETGHLVLATLHTSSASKTINRIIDVFPSDEKTLVRSMLSSSLRTVIAQTLVKKIEGGRVAAWEIMVATPAIRNLIREDKIAQMQSTMQTGRATGMQTLEQHLKQLWQLGIINLESAREKATDQDSF